MAGRQALGATRRFAGMGNRLAKGAAVAAVAFAIAAGAGAADRAGWITQQRLERADAEPGSWLNTGRNYAEDHYSPLDQIDASTVSRLKLAWYQDLDTDRGQEANPIVVDGVMYTTSAWSKVFALDARSGKLLWSYDPAVNGRKGYDACCDVVNRGVAVYEGKVFVGALDGRLIALDAASGKVLWDVQTTDTSRPYTITGAPRVVRGKVLIGNGGAEYGVRGYVSAYDAASGKLVWRFYTVPNPNGKPDGAASDAIFEKIGNKSWGPNGAWKEVGGGGTVWDAIVYDQELDQILIGVGNGSPWNRRVRSGDEGDNLFLSSIVALDPDTGAYKWHFQEVPGEEWDFTATQPIILADMPVAGKPRKVLFHAPKNGFFYVIDRASGKPVSIKNFVPVNWADGYDEKSWRPLGRPEARYTESGKEFLAMPSAFGAHNWHPMSFSPKTGLVYIPVQLMGFGYADDKNFTYRPGHWNLGNGSRSLLGPQSDAQLAAARAATKGRLLAWDPVKQEARFTVEHPAPSNGGILSTAGNLLFQGQPDGTFSAFDAKDGKKLWSFDAQNGVIAAPISFSLDGEQYIAVMAGLGGSFGVSSPFAPNPHKRPNGRLLVFQLAGKASLPPYQKPVMPAQLVSDSFPAGAAERGLALYAGQCSLCHGPGGYSAGVIPDLRRSPTIASRELFHQVVLDGILQQRGMISFRDMLKPEQVEEIRAYLGMRAAALKESEGS